MMTTDRISKPFGLKVLLALMLVLVVLVAPNMMVKRAFAADETLDAPNQKQDELGEEVSGDDEGTAPQSSSQQEPVDDTAEPDQAADEDQAADDGQVADQAPDRTADSSASADTPAGAAAEDPAASATAVWDVTVTPNRNTTTAAISLDDSIVSQNLFDSVTFTATMTYDGKVMRKAEQTFSVSDFAGGASPTMDFGNYGKFSFVATFKLSGAVVRTNDPVTVGIVADTYNISPVSASLPVTFFSLNLWGQNNIRETGPVILMMERPSAYDWNALPEGVYGVPYISMEDLTYQPDVSLAGYNFIAKQPALAAYVRDLYEVSPDSTFNLYVVDVYICLVQHVLYANKIPESQYFIYMLSDGTASASRFNSFYNRADAQAHNQQLVNEWESYKNYAYETGTVSSSVPDVGSSKWYIALMTSEDNIEFWVARKDVFTSPKDGNVFGQKFQSDPKVKQVNIGSLLASNIQSSDTATAEFKRLYNFNDSFFAVAEEQGKDVMMFLGSRVNLEDDFESYARFVMSYYGDDYVYYYKGHPATPTDLYPEKQEQLERLGVTDVESSIAAELILFFNPEIYLSGFASSTYDSVPVGMGKGMFRMTRKSGLSNVQYLNMDYWMSKVTEESDPRFVELVTATHECFVAEFSDKVAIARGVATEGVHGVTADPANMDKNNTEYIAIWDATDSMINYYQLNEDKSAYVLVGTEDGLSGKEAVPAGTYAIMTEKLDGMVLDVEGGSTSAGANVRLWKSNDTEAQRWTVSYDEDGLATITNVKTGMVLDVSGGKVEKQANVWQWRNNGSLAQKWRLVRTNKGTIKVVSAKNPAYALDLASGKTDKGTNLQMWADNGSKAQQWRFVSVEPEVRSAGQAQIEDGCYKVVSTLDLSTSYQLQLANWGRSSGTNVQVATATDKLNQVWRITKQQSGFYRINSVWVDLSLDVAGPSVVPGANVRLATPVSGKASQEWAIFARTGGTYIVQNVASGLLLGVEGGKLSEGANVQGGLTVGEHVQTWLLRPAEDPTAILDALAKENAGLVGSGVSAIKSATDGTLVFDVRNGSTASGAAVQVWKANGTAAQKWIVLHDPKGYLIIFSSKSGMVLDVRGGKVIPGTTVQQYRYNGTDAQKWVAVEAEKGVRLISAVDPSVCLAVKGDVAKGADLVLAEVGDGSAQEFAFSK